MVLFLNFCFSAATGHIRSCVGDNDEKPEHLKMRLNVLVSQKKKKRQTIIPSSSINYGEIDYNNDRILQ